VTADITTAFSGGTYTNGMYGGTYKGDDRSDESALGNEVANSMFEALSDPQSGGAQIGVVNPGALRADLLYGGRGIISYAEANAVLPSAISLSTLTLTGIQFKQLLEQQWQTTADNTLLPSHPYLQLALSDNVSYTFDPDAQHGSHITSVIVNGEPLARTANYRIGTLSYLAAGGDNFRVLAEATANAESGLIDRDAWIAYLTAHPGLAPNFARRSVGISGLRELPAPGGTATLKINMLDMTSLGAPENTSLAVQLISSAADPVITELGNFPVTDGTATVTFRIPPGGAEYLVMTATPSNTEVKVPLQMIEPAKDDTGQPAAGVDSSATTRPVLIGVVAALLITWLTIAVLRRRRNNN
jgi:5'-nucleotidase